MERNETFSDSETEDLNEIVRVSIDDISFLFSNS